jgi:hypothetical protein
MWQRYTRLGPLAALAIAAGALAGCGQYNQTSSDADVHRDEHQAQSNSEKVEKRAEHASRDLARGATALVMGVKKGVNEGVQQGKRDAQARSQSGRVVVDRPSDAGESSEPPRDEPRRPPAY